MAEPTNNNNNVPNGNGANSNPSNSPTNQNNNGQEPNNGQPAGGQEPNNSGKMIPEESYKVVAEKLRKANEELENIKKANEEKEKAQLAEQGKYKELYEKKEAEIAEMKNKATESAKTNAVKGLATKLGAVDTDVVVKLLDLSKVTVSEDGTVDSNTVTALLETLKKEKAYLFGQPATPQGNPNGGNPDGGSNTVKQFKRSQIADHAFYKANEKDILEAYKTGNIIDDISQK